MATTVCGDARGRGPTDRAIYAALLITARRHGRSVKSGIKVYISVRALALAAGVSWITAMNALKRLAKAGLVYRSSGGREHKPEPLYSNPGTQTPSNLYHSTTRGEYPDSGKRLRELLRIRWGAGRVGKAGALYLEHIARLGSATVRELFERTSRRLDNVRRALRKLEARALVECADGVYRLVPEFAGALARSLDLDGVPETERLQRERYERHRAGYVSWLEERRRRRKPDGYISDLEPVQSSGKPAPDAVIADAEAPDQLGELAALVRERIAEHQRKHRRKHRHRPGRGRSEPPVCSAVSSEKTRSVSPRCAPTPAL